MCLTRVAQVVSTDGGRAKISYLDSHETSEADVSMVNARRGSYVEIFADVAIGRLTKKEAELKRDLRLELLRRAGRSP